MARVIGLVGDNYKVIVVVFVILLIIGIVKKVVSLAITAIILALVISLGGTYIKNNLSFDSSDITTGITIKSIGESTEIDMSRVKNVIVSNGEGGKVVVDFVGVKKVEVNKLAYNVAIKVGLEKMGVGIIDNR